MLRIAETTVCDKLDAVQDLLRENWAETGFDFPLNLNVAAYEHAEAAGILIGIEATDDGVPIGYSTAFILPHPFNPAVVFCHTDALFVAKTHRGTSAGARLIAATERAAKARGASRILWHTRAGTTLAGVLAERPGYTPVDVVVQKEL